VEKAKIIYNPYGREWESYRSFSSIIIPFFEISVLSKEEAFDLCVEEPNKWCVISIWANPLDSTIYSSWFGEPQFSKAKKVSSHHFHDITSKSKIGGQLCTKQDIKDILSFSQKCIGESLLIHCAAGISRSTAVAFLIVLNAIKDKCKNPAEEALAAVYKIRPIMYPNKHILELGISLIARNKEEQIAWFRELYNSPIMRRIIGG
jgi:hypothetical protein